MFKKIKKSTAVFATVLLMSSSINLNAKSVNNSLNTNPYTCWDVADVTVSAFQTANLLLRNVATYEQEYRIWEAAYDACMAE